MSCAFLSCFGAPPDSSPQTFYSAGGRSLASTFRTGASFVTALEHSPATGAAPAASPPKRARSLAAALEAAADEAGAAAGRPLSAASSAAAAHDGLEGGGHEEPLTSHPLRSPSPSPSRSVKMVEVDAFEDVDLASSPSPPPAQPSRSALGVIGVNVFTSVFTRKQQAAPAFGAPAAVVAADARSRAFRNPLFE